MMGSHCILDIFGTLAVRAELVPPVIQHMQHIQPECVTQYDEFAAQSCCHSCSGKRRGTLVLGSGRAHT